VYCAAAYWLTYDFFWVMYPGQIMDEISKQIIDTPRSAPKISNYISWLDQVLIYIYILHQIRLTF